MGEGLHHVPLVLGELLILALQGPLRSILERLDKVAAVVVGSPLPDGDVCLSTMSLATQVNPTRGASIHG